MKLMSKIIILLQIKNTFRNAIIGHNRATVKNVFTKYNLIVYFRLFHFRLSKNWKEY